MVIWANINSSAQGWQYIINNVVLDYQVAPIQPCDGYPGTAASWVTGSKIFLQGNYPGITNSLRPITQAGGGDIYETDTGAKIYYDAVNSQWVNTQALIGSKTHDWASLASGAYQTTTVTVTGAVLGDMVTGVSMNLDVAGTIMWGHVTATNTVTVTHHNPTNGAVDLSSGTLKVRVQKN